MKNFFQKMKQMPRQVTQNLENAATNQLKYTNKF